MPMSSYHSQYIIAARTSETEGHGTEKTLMVYFQPKMYNMSKIYNHILINIFNSEFGMLDTG